MRTIYLLTVIDGYGSGEGSATAHPTLADAEATLRANYDQDPADYADLDFEDLQARLASRDGLNITVHEIELGLPFSPEEFGLLRAGLAAHSIAVKQVAVTEDDIATARKQAEACRELSIRLGEAQIAQGA